MAWAQKMQAGLRWPTVSSCEPSPTLSHATVMALAPFVRSCSICASRHLVKPETKTWLKSARCMTPPERARHWRTASAITRLKEAFTPASFACAQMEACEGEAMQ